MASINQKADKDIEDDAGRAYSESKGVTSSRGARVAMLQRLARAFLTWDGTLDRKTRKAANALRPLARSTVTSGANMWNMECDLRLAISEAITEESQGDQPNEDNIIDFEDNVRVRNAFVSALAIGADESAIARAVRLARAAEGED